MATYAVSRFFADYTPGYEDFCEECPSRITDTDENGTPTDEMWEVLADQLNDTAGQLDDPQERALDHLRETMAARDAEHERAAAIIAAADGEIRADVLACIDAHIPVPTIGEVLGVTRARIYQIRDGRR